MDDTWWHELARIITWEPHFPEPCLSIASSSPIALWQCPVCYRTVLQSRNHQPYCTGGLPVHRAPLKLDVREYENGNGNMFGDRTHTLASLGDSQRFSRETGSPEAIDYHRDWLSTHTLP